jgi:hypothetical protein
MCFLVRCNPLDLAKMAKIEFDRINNLNFGQHLFCRFWVYLPMFPCTYARRIIHVWASMPLKVWWKVCSCGKKLVVRARPWQRQKRWVSCDSWFDVFAPNFVVFSTDLRGHSHMRLRAHDQYTSSTPVRGKGGAGPSSLHTTFEGLMECVNVRWK